MTENLPTKNFAENLAIRKQKKPIFKTFNYKVIAYPNNKFQLKIYSRPLTYSENGTINKSDISLATENDILSPTQLTLGSYDADINDFDLINDNDSFNSVVADLEKHKHFLDLHNLARAKNNYIMLSLANFTKIEEDCLFFTSTNKNQPKAKDRKNWSQADIDKANDDYFYPLLKTLTNLKSRYHVEYSLILEFHKSGFIHAHGFLKHYPKKWLTPVLNSNGSAKLDKGGRPMFSVDKLTKFGLCYATQIVENPEAAVFYQTKYMLKDVDNKPRYKMFYHSQGLLMPGITLGYKDIDLSNLENITKLSDYLESFDFKLFDNNITCYRSSLIDLDTLKILLGKDDNN